MERSTALRTTIGLLIAAVLVAVASVGIARGGESRISDPVSIELHTSGCATDDHDPETDCRLYPLRDEGGERSGFVSRFREPVTDADGNLVGRQYAECFFARGAGEMCTLIEVLSDGPYTDRGSVTLATSGNDRLAVTGGTGAYANARGQARLELADAGFVLTLDLIP